MNSLAAFTVIMESSNAKVGKKLILINHDCGRWQRFSE